MTVPQVVISITRDQLKLRRVAKQLIACRNPNRIIRKLDTTQPPVPPSPGKINLTGVPVDLLLDLLGRKIDELDTTVALTLLGASHH